MFSEAVLPLAGMIGGVAIAAATAPATIAALTGAAVTTSLFGLSAASATALVALDLTEAVAVATVVAAGVAVQSSAAAVVRIIIANAQKDHIEMNSMGWYFGGENLLEVRGGIDPQRIEETGEYHGEALYVVDSRKPDRRS